MLFNDPHFLFLFLPATLAAYVLARRLAGPRAVLAVLLVASMVFYGVWNPIYLPLLGASTLFNFLTARAIGRALRAGHGGRASALLALGVTVDLAVLGWFKYLDFAINTADALLGAGWPLWHIVLPLGISFFTFQKIAYLVDARRARVEPHDLLEYAFFVMFFPQLIAGPIVHHSEIFHQTKGRGAFALRPGNLAVGLTCFAIGLFKKVVIADRLAPLASSAFGAAAAHHDLTVLDAWQGAFAYTLQLYFDFSGYSDMAIGAARLFGVRLPRNFHSPYQATGIIDFWRRWHMTLSRFLRDYLYIALGGNRHGKARRYLNLMLTMTIGGLWHGAGWNFVLWGFLHGAGLIVNHAWRAVWPQPIDRWWSRAVARLVTLLFVLLAWVPFRAPSLAAAGTMYRAMLGLGAGAAPAAADAAWVALWAAAWIAVLWYVPNTQQLLARYRPTVDYGPAEARADPPALARLGLGPLLEWRPSPLAGVVFGVLTALALLGLGHVSEFLYFEF